MSKTNFINGDAAQGLPGTRVTAEFLNAVNKHHHTGLDEDGHGALPYAEDNGIADAYVVNLNPALTQYVTGMPLYFKAANANTGASTINVNGLGIKTIKKLYNQDLIAGDIMPGQVVGIIYDGFNFQLGGLPSRIATLDENSQVVQDPASKGLANGVASIDANRRLVQDATTLWDGTAGRSASVTSAPNKVPVSDSSGKIDFTAVNADSLTMQGETGTENSGDATVLSTTTDIISLSLGDLWPGDRILIMGNVRFTKGATAGANSVWIEKSAGTALIQFNYNDASIFSPGSAQSAAANTYWYGQMNGIIKVTSGGTLTISMRGISAGSNSTVSAGRADVYAVFLKKNA